MGSCVIPFLSHLIYYSYLRAEERKRKGNIFQIFVSQQLFLFGSKQQYGRIGSPTPCPCLRAIYFPRPPKVASSFYFPTMSIMINCAPQGTMLPQHHVLKEKNKAFC